MNDIKCTKTHEWVNTKPNSDNTVNVGITDHAQSLLGDLVFVELPTIGKKVKQGEEFAVVESVKAASDVYAPISGTITAVNSELQANPGLINQAPYDSGWLVKIMPDNHAELDSLMDKTSYETAQGA
jgi:glycine cleavage system H protein